MVRGEPRPIPSRLSLVPAEPEAVVAAPPAAPSTPTHTATDATFIAILERAPDPSETLLTGFARKEAELRASFAALTVNEAREIHKRLSISHPSDLLAQKFKRLTAERRARLINFLADARRRAALANGKR